MKCFVLDMDGTVYLGENAIDCAVEFISELKREGISCQKAVAVAPV